jgi:hypothetical protein
MKARDYNKREIEAGNITFEHVSEATQYAQAVLGLEPDGMLGPKTRAALEAIRVPGTPERLTRSQIEIIKVAREELGKGEAGRNNFGPDIDRYAHAIGWPPTTVRPFMWCAAFAYYCAKEGYKRAGVPFAVQPSAAVWRLADNIMASGGQKLPEPVPGCLVVSKRTGGPRAMHARICEHVTALNIGTVEGNAGPKVRRHSVRKDDLTLLGFFAWPGLL